MDKYIRIKENNEVIDVPVSEELYNLYYSYKWKEEKQRERESRCVISGKNGKLIRCTGKCSDCLHERNRMVVSLDIMEEYVPYTSDMTFDLLGDPSHYCIDKERYNELYKAINNLSNDDRMIIHMYMQGYSEAVIGKKMNMTQKGINKLKQRIFTRLRNVLKDKML